MSQVVFTALRVYDWFSHMLVALLTNAGRTIFQRTKFWIYESWSKALLIFSFNFRFLSTVTSWLTERERLTSDCSIRKLRQRGTSKHVQLMRTNYVPKHSRDHVASEYGVDRKGAEFIGNKQIHSLSQTYRHSTLCISADYYYSYSYSYSYFYLKTRNRRAWIKCKWQLRRKRKLQHIHKNYNIKRKISAKMSL